ncbi:MAG: AmmeMemoRadiSam system protein A [Betaproteobacteria bacterium]
MRERGQTVIGIARASIEKALGAAARVDLAGAPWLREHGSSFVTLRRDGDLRGCIGSLEAWRPLGVDIAENAVAAALHDRRFPPVEMTELALLEVEVSLLTPSEPLPCADEADALRKLRPGIDGVVIEFGHHRATFLPQVWENLPDAPIFLRELKLKAGLPDSFWHPDLRVRRYGVEKHCEWRSHNE